MSSSIGCCVLPQGGLPIILVLHQRGVQSFWQGLYASEKGKEFWAQHPVLAGKEPTDLKRHLPLMVFDDTGPVSKKNSTFCRCWYSLLGVGDERSTRFPIGTGLKDDPGPDLSWPVVLDSFAQLAQPVEDPESFGGVLLFFGADLEYMCNVVGFKHFNKNDPCPYCRATNSTRPHNNFHETAEWRPTILSNAEFLAELRRPLHPMVTNPWFGLHTYRMDLLHLIDHHGVANNIVGNTFWLHISGDRMCDVLPGNTVEGRLESLNAEITQWYSDNRIANRLPPLKISNIKAEAFPDLSGPAIKAANTRAIVPYALALQRMAVAMQPNRTHKHMAKALESLQAVIDIFYDNSMFLTPDTMTSLRRHLARLGSNFQVLQTLSLAAEQTRWKTQVKMHLCIAHLADQAALVNPRFTHGYRSESLVGTICTIYKASQDGPFRPHVQHVALLKYRTAMKLMWK